MVFKIFSLIRGLLLYVHKATQCLVEGFKKNFIFLVNDNFHWLPGQVKTFTKLINAIPEFINAKEEEKSFNYPPR